MMLKRKLLIAVWFAYSAVAINDVAAQAIVQPAPTSSAEPNRSDVDPVRQQWVDRSMMKILETDEPLVAGDHP